MTNYIICAHKSSLTPPLFIEVPVPSQEIEWSCIEVPVPSQEIEWSCIEVPVPSQEIEWSCICMLWLSTLDLIFLCISFY
jgi:hypothetical protein